MANNVVVGETTFRIGDTIQVHYKLIEKEKEAGKAKREVHEKISERIQIFEGIVLAIRGSQENKSFTVRRIGAGNIGIERIFPVISPWIKKITVVESANVRRSKLYYLRDLHGREALLKGKVKKTAVKKGKSTSAKKKPTTKHEEKKSA